MAIGCELEMICKYAPCHIIEICKFRDTSLDDLSKKKQPPKPKPVSRSARAMSLTTSELDIKKARETLKQLIRDDRLGENQLKALEKTKGIHYINLTDVDKEQILSILQDVLKGEKN